MSNFTPMEATGFIISEYRIAASTPSLRTGIKVTSAASSGWLQISSSEYFSLILRYSGS
ncbi:hypothetical protein D3C72_2358510 [compost metagenome]